MTDDITLRITDVLRKHIPEALAYNVRCSSGCREEFYYGEDGDDWEDRWSAHVAEEIAKELGLTQFWSVGFDDGYQDEGSTDQLDIAQERLAEFRDADPDGGPHLVTTWFTGWVRADTEEQQ